MSKTLYSYRVVVDPNAFYNQSFYDLHIPCVWLKHPSDFAMLWYVAPNLFDGAVVAFNDNIAIDTIHIHPDIYNKLRKHFQAMGAVWKEDAL